MKRILVTGATGYIGRSFCQYMERFPGEYTVDPVSLRGPWDALDFSKYDAVVHAAGLAHIRETEKNTPLYYSVNRDLTAAAAQKARAEGAGQFLFISSMSVYGIDEGVITPDTVPQPRSSYGKSKLEAEQLLESLRTDRFPVAILRPPMVYGRDCGGNYRALVKLANLLPVCPAYENRRSAISIGNLCVCIKAAIDGTWSGIFCPQDPDYMSTCHQICRIARESGRQLQMTSALNFIPLLMKRFTARGRKAFGNLVYCNEDQHRYAGVQLFKVHRGGSPVCAAPDLDGF